MKYLISIDCGGSKTDILITDIKGSVEYLNKYEGINFSYINNDEFIKKIYQYIEDVLKSSEIDINLIDSLVIGTAGVYREDEIEFLENSLKKYEFKVYVISDIEMGFYSAFPTGVGVVLSVGTGSICFGIDAKGKKIRSGGWGYLLGDEGSGFSIGCSGIKAALKAYEKRGPDTLILKLLFEFIDSDDINGVIPFIYKSENSIRRISEFAPEVIKAAEKGDKVAVNILDNEIKQLVKLIKSAMSIGYFPKTKTVKLMGGIIDNNAVIYQKLRDELPKISIEINSILPVYGGINFLKKIKKSN